MNSLVLSIDPGSRCGIAQVYVDKPDPERLFFTSSYPLAHLWENLADTAEGCAAVILEDTRQLPVYARYGAKVMSRAARDRMCMNIGQVHMATKLLEERCHALGLPVILHTPRGRAAKKWTPKQYQAYTHTTGKASGEHVRDAVRNAWGYTRLHVADAIQRTQAEASR